jgi:hypothetical protein
VGSEAKADSKADLAMIIEPRMEKSSALSGVR